MPYRTKDKLNKCYLRIKNWLFQFIQIALVKKEKLPNSPGAFNQAGLKEVCTMNLALSLGFCFHQVIQIQWKKSKNC